MSVLCNYGLKHHTERQKVQLGETTSTEGGKGCRGRWASSNGYRRPHVAGLSKISDCLGSLG